MLTTLVVAACLAFQADAGASPTPPADPAAQVKQLVLQLDARERAVREAAARGFAPTLLMSTY